LTLFFLFRKSLNQREQNFQRVAELPTLLSSLDQVRMSVMHLESSIDSGHWGQVATHFEQFSDARAQFLGYLHQFQWWPKLNDTERLVALLLMRFRSTKDISEAAELSAAYVNNVRSILREKLGLAVDVDLSEFLIQEASNLVLRIAQPMEERTPHSNDMEALRNEVKRVQSQRNITEANQAKMLRMLVKLSQQLPDLNAMSGSMNWAALQPFGLTPTERQVVELLVRGYSNGSIANILECSMSRIYQCRGAIRSKLNISRIEPLAEHLRSVVGKKDSGR
jgi:DNA-binding CsgD family transcriptional regulator